MEIKENLSLQLLEYAPMWEKTEENLIFLSKILEDLPSADILILPEMFNTGFSMNPSGIAEEMNGKTIEWMLNFSLKKNTALCGSMAIKENQCYYNRFIFVAQGKIISHYDKHHLFSYGGESDFYTAGNEKITFSYLGWKLCPMICFDLRFPVWNRNTEDYDLLINVANWPDSRIDAWDTLLKARSIENVSFVCGVNRIGTDGMNLNYNGHSVIFSPIGENITPTKINDFVYCKNISYSDLSKWRNKYRFLEERDTFKFT